MTPAATVDAERVAEVCRLAVAALPHASRAATQALHCVADGEDIAVVLASTRERRAAARALRRHGYRLRVIPDGSALCVAGLNADALEPRITALCRAVGALERALPRTIAAAAHAYARLHCRIEPAIALYGTADALRADVASVLARQVGPLPRRCLVPRGLEGPQRERIAAVDELTGRALDLLAQHWHVAVQAAERVGELSHRHPLPAAEVRAVAEIRADVTRQRRRTLYLDARQWAGHHLDSRAAPAFAAWYAAEHGPPRWPVAPFADAGRRWAALDHARPGAGSPADGPHLSQTSGGSQ